MISREIFFSVCCVFATIYFTVGFDVDFEHFYYSLRENVFCELRNFVLRFRNWRKLVDLEKKLEFEFKICENGSSLKREYSLQKIQKIVENLLKDFSHFTNKPKFKSVTSEPGKVLQNSIVASKIRYI